MAIRKTIYQREEDGALFIGDTIEYQGKLWLVPEWIEGREPGTERPARIVCVDGFGLANAGSLYQADYLLTVPVSTNILEGRVQAGQGVVIEKPDIILSDADFHR